MELDKQERRSGEGKTRPEVVPKASGNSEKERERR